MKLHLRRCAIAVLSLSFLTTGCAHRDGDAPRSADPGARPPLYPQLAEELRALAAEDQRVRARMSGAVVDSALASEMRAIDERNTQRLKAIIDEYGWPGPRSVGPEATDAAWLLVQHADHDRAFQKHMLYMLRPAMVSGDLSKQNYALLEDRVAVAEGRPQRYGSQVRVTQGPAGVVCEPFEIEDPARLDARRKEMGLEPHADYMNRIRAEFSQAGPG